MLILDDGQALMRQGMNIYAEISVINKIFNVIIVSTYKYVFL